MFIDASRRQRLTAALFIGLLVLVVCAGRAQAVTPVTSSSITAPADPTFLFDSGQVQSVTIAGTSNGNGSQVDIGCYHDNGNNGTAATVIASGVTVGTQGNFSTSVPISAFGGLQCRLRAVPAGTTPGSGLGVLTGPRVVGAQFISGQFDYQLTAPQLSAGGSYSSLGSRGYRQGFLDNPSVFGQSTINTFGATDILANPALSGGGRPGAEVDGLPAYTPHQANSVSPGGTGEQSVTSSASQNASNGDVTVTESEPLLTCPTVNPPGTGCAAFLASGIQLTRTITQTADGHVIYVEDAYSSTDGAAHTVDLLVGNVQDFGRGSGTSGVGYEFPGQTKFTEPKASSTVLAPTAVPNSILIDTDTTTDGSINGARGAITYGQLPSSAFAFPNSSPDQGFDTPTVFTVPGSGSVPLRFAYASEFTLAAAQSDASAAQTRFDEAMIAISSPVNGATETASPVTVSGTVSSTSGATRVTVNGVAASLSGNSYAVALPLSPGPNTLTAVLTTAHGSSASASTTVTYAPPPPPPSPPPAPVAPTAATSAATAVSFTAATLAGSVIPGSSAAAYHFDYGTTVAYGHSTAPGAAAASTTASAVTAAITGLVPGSTYHFRLVASSSDGSSTGPDLTLSTPVVAPQRLITRAGPSRDRHAPYAYRISGRLLVPRGVICSGGVGVIGAAGRRIVFRGTAQLSRNCAYALHTRFSGQRLHGHGTIVFSLHYRGAHGISQRSGPAVTVRFG